MSSRVSHSDLVSSALDPHKRAALTRALEVVLADRSQPVVALVGWEAATLIDVVYKRASQVLILEDDHALVESIKRGLLAKDLGGKVRLFEQHLDQLHLDTRADVIVTSIASTWFIDGDEARRLNLLRSRVLATHGAIIPRRVTHLFELAASPHDIGGFSLRVPRTSRPGEPVAVLGESKHFITHDLHQELPETIDDTIIVKPLLAGTITGLRLRTLCELAENVTQLTSAGGVQSIIVPLREDVVAQAAQPVSVQLRYTLGAGLHAFQARARALSHQESHSPNPTQQHIIDAFKAKLRLMAQDVDQRGRGADLDKVVGYTLQPHGDVSRLTALFWTVDEEFRKPLRDLVDAFKREVSAVGPIPDDEAIYELLLSTYHAIRGS